MHVISSEMKAVYKQRPQVVKRYLSVLPYDVVYTAQVNGAPTRDAKTNGQIDIPFDNGNGALADVVEDMTMAVGTSPGASDVGLLRIRKAPVAGTFYVGETAPGEVPVSDNLYLTVYDDFTRWSVKPRLVGLKDNTEFEEYHDYDVAYDNQNRHREPIVNIVARVVDVATKQFVPLKHAGWVDAGQTYRTVELDCGLSEMVGDGADPNTYTVSWNVQGWTVVEGSVSSAYLKVRMPVGASWVSCTITDSNAVSKTGRRHLWTHDRDSYPPYTQLKVTKDSRRQWREMQIEFFEKQGANEDTSRSAIPYSCLVCYWEVATFGGDPAPDGYIDQFVGWVTDDEVELVKGKSRHRLNIAGSGWWADHIAGYMTTLSDHGGQDHWWEFKDPTVDLVAHYVLRETTTFMTLCNLFLSGDATPVGGEDVNDGSVWRQINDLASGARAVAGSDSGGGIWIRPHYSYLEWTDAYLGYEERSARPPLISIDPSDLRQGELTIARRHYKPVGWVNADGSWYQDGKESKQLYSKAPGLTPGDGADKTSAPYQRVGGATEQVAQKRLNAYGGHWLARENREIQDFGLPLIDAMDAFEPCWNAPLLFSWPHANPAGLTFSNAELLVTGVDVQHSNERGQPPKRVTPTVEQVTGGYPGDAYYPPEVKVPGWVFPPITFYWPGFNTTIVPILQFGGAPLLYDFGAQPGPVAAILSDGTVRRVEDFYDLNTTLTWDDEIDLGVDNLYAAARNPYSPAYRPPYTSNDARAVIVYGSAFNGNGVDNPVIATLTDIGGTPSVINPYALPGVAAFYSPKILYHPGVKGLIVVSGQVMLTGGTEACDALYVSDSNGVSWTPFLFDTSVTNGAALYGAQDGPGVFLRRLSSTRIEVATGYRETPGDPLTDALRTFVSTDTGGSFSLRADNEIPFLSDDGDSLAAGNIWPSLTTNSNDDLALLVRAGPALMRSYRASAYADLDDITPIYGVDEEGVVPLTTVGNSLAFAANDRESAVWVGHATLADKQVVFGTDKLTRMTASQWREIDEDADLRSAILDRDGKAAYFFGENGTVKFQPSFPLGTVYNRSIPGATARVLELVALKTIVWTTTYDFTTGLHGWSTTGSQDSEGIHSIPSVAGPNVGKHHLSVWISTGSPTSLYPTTNITSVTVTWEPDTPGAEGNPIGSMYVIANGNGPTYYQNLSMEYAGTAVETHTMEVPGEPGPNSFGVTFDAYAYSTPLVVTSITITGTGDPLP